MTIFQAVPVVLLLLQIPLLALLFRRAHRLARGQAGATETCSGCCERWRRWSAPLENAQAERRALRDQLEECFDVTAAKLDMLTPEEDLAAFPRGWRTSWLYAGRPDGRRHDTSHGKAGLGPVLPGGGL